MAKIEKKPVKITETVLRDAHQSLIATRMRTEQMLPIIDKMDKVGYHSVECWGGATFDASLRFLKEDPWERLRKLRDGFKNTKLQMLFRGQNILGYRHYADDVVEYFVQKSIANGIDIIRIFDCLNDIRNLETAVRAANKENGHAQIALSYTLGDAYTLDYWKDIAKRIEDMGAESICIKDMAGLLVPVKATELVTALKESVKIPIQMHTHYTSGVASMTYMKSVEAGADVIDTAISPFSMGTSQPATEVMVEAFKGTPYDTGLDQNLLAEIADYFRPIQEDALKTGLLNPKVMGVNIKTTSGPAIERPGDMAAILNSLGEGDILFIDEIHRLNRMIEEILYPAMEDFAIDIVIGKGAGARSVRLDLPKFTLIGATTRIGLLTAPLRDRFGVIHRLELYDISQLKTIIKRSASVLDIPIDDKGAEEIARRSRGTPRIANRLLKRVRDFAQVKYDGEITEEVSKYALDLLEVDKMGLDNVDRKMLLAMIEKFSGGPVGVDTLAVSIGEEAETIEDVYEPYLIQLGYIQRTPRGRIVTDLGYKHFGIGYLEK